MDLSKIIQGKKLTETEEAILHYMIQHIDEVLSLGVRTVARENFTSPATVIRLAKKLGYQGFIDFYYHLEPLVNRDRKQTENGYAPSVPVACIQQFAKMMRELGEQHIFIYATGFSSIIAEYMYKKLLVNGKRALLASGTDSVGILESNRSMAGMFVTITKSGETEQVLSKMTYFKEQGIPIVTFTNEADNRAAKLADLVFAIPDDEKLDDRNIQGNTYFAHVLYVFEEAMKMYQQS